MKQTTNLSIYKYDIEQLADTDGAIEQFLKEHQLDGLELLIGYEPSDVIPRKYIGGVHLPFWVTWLDIWQEKPGAVDRYFGTVDRSYIHHLCGGTTRSEMLTVQADLWREAARLGAAYAVIHACHLEMSHAFSRKFTYSDEEVLTAFADMMNQTAAQFPGGEPPITIAMENLWWPGLTFKDNRLTEDFISKLKFNNWCFVLDTGHLLNTCHEIEGEEESISFLKSSLSALPEAILEKIEVVHLSYSCSGAYQLQTISRGVPEGFYELSFGEKFKMAREHASAIDYHAPFSSTGIDEIVKMIAPEFLVHEFLGTIDERRVKLKQQVPLISR